MLTRYFAIYNTLGSEMKSLQSLVEENPDVFRDAVRETEATLFELEDRLGVVLPVEVKWFLLECGSGGSGAVPNARASISDTIRFRAAIALPSRYVVLEERNDGGSVFLDTSTGSVAWVDSHAVSAFAAGTALDSEYDEFPTFAAWVKDCVEWAHD